MAYSDFTLAKVRETFGLTLDEKQNLFSTIAPVSPTALLTTLLAEYLPLATAINTEKARSEFLIAQILTEVRRQLDYRISLFSGTEFNVDASQGLTGFCDFILSAAEEQMEITAPVVMLVEAKKENLIGGLGQCIASMVAAQRYNQQQQQVIPIVYGAVTSGTVWRFITLRAQQVGIDQREYYISEVNQLLGILLSPFQTRFQATNALR